jgi:APA family basic amino acid/polyamine antiporter
MVIYLILVIIVLIFYILTILGYSSFRKMPDAERPYKALVTRFLPGLYIVWLLLFASLFFTKTSTSGWGVCY